MGSSVLMPLYVQSVMGYSAVISGLITLPGSLATTLVSPFAGRIYDKMGIKRLFVIGSAIMLFSNIGNVLFNDEYASLDSCCDERDTEMFPSEV